MVTSLQAEWIQIQPQNRIVPRRSGHTTFVVPTHDGGGEPKSSTTYVFGGYAETNNNENSSNDDNGDNIMKRFVVNDLWKYETTTSLSKENDSNNIQHPGWTLVPTQQGDIPGPRLVATSAVVGSKAYIFGGWDPETAGTGGTILDAVHELDIATATWKQLRVHMPDGPTSRHVSVALSDSNRILLHTHRCIDYVLLFDPIQHTFTKQPTTGPCPSSRGLHCCAALVMNDDENSENDDPMVCFFGGAAQNQQMSNEVHVLNIKTWTWTQLDVVDESSSSSCPTPRAGACLVAIPHRRTVVLFGGAETTPNGLRPRADVWALSLDRDINNDRPIQWELLLSDENNDVDTTKKNAIQPPPRNAASLTPIDNSYMNFLLIGGWAPFRQTWDDCSYVLRLLSH